MEWQEKRIEFSGDVKSDNALDSTQNGYKRNSFTTEYLQAEKKEVIFGGYAPSVTDSTNLRQKFVANQTVPHYNESLYEGPIVDSVPLSIALTDVSGVVPPVSEFKQVKLIRYFFVLII